MTEDLFWQWEIQSHQEDWPVNGVEADDVFTDQVQVSRPILVEHFAVIAIAVIADTGDVVGQCIQPNVSYVFWIEGNRNTPGEGGTGYAEILQTWQQEVVHHFVFTGNRLNEFRMFVDVFDEAVSVFAHFEEVSFFFCRLNFTAAVRAFAVNQLAFGEEGFAWGAVHTFVVAFVDVAFVVEVFEDFLNLFFVVGVGGANKFIVGSVHQIPDAFDFASSTVNEFFWSYAGCFCFFFDFLTMFVSTGLEVNIKTHVSFVSCDAVCKNDFVGVADVRFTGSVRNGSRDVIFVVFHC